jgi:type I restriction enzyme S subunit
MKIVEIGKSNIKIADGNYSAKYPRADEFIPNGIPFIRANNFENKSITDKDLHFISKEKHSELKKGHIKPRDVLITTRGNIGQVALVPQRHDDSNINAQIVLLRCNEGWHPEYLLHAFSSDYVSRQLPSLTTGTALKQLPVKKLKKLKIPLPPLPQQKKIAAILDAADAYRQKTKALIEKYDALTQSLFLDMFGDPVTNPKGWDSMEMGHISTISSGSTPSRKNEKNFSGEIPWVKTGEVNGSIILDSSEKISEVALANSSCKIYPKGSLIVAMYGQGKTRGQVGVLGINAATNQACAVLQPSEKMNFEFLLQQLKMCYLDLRDLGRGGNQPNLNLKLIKTYKVISPPMIKQNKFSEILNTIIKQKLKTHNNLIKSENLFKSLLQKAFKGEVG